MTTERHVIFWLCCVAWQGHITLDNRSVGPRFLLKSLCYRYSVLLTWAACAKPIRLHFFWNISSSIGVHSLSVPTVIFHIVLLKIRWSFSLIWNKLIHTALTQRHTVWIFRVTQWQFSAKASLLISSWYFFRTLKCMYLIKLFEILLSHIWLKVPSQHSGIYLSQYSAPIIPLLQPYFKRPVQLLRHSLSKWWVRWHHLYVEKTGAQACMCRQRDKIIKCVRETCCIQWTQADLMYYKSSPVLCSFPEKHFADTYVLSSLCRGSCSEFCLETARENKSLCLKFSISKCSKMDILFSVVSRESVLAAKRKLLVGSHLRVM